MNLNRFGILNSALVVKISVILMFVFAISQAFAGNKPNPEHYFEGDIAVLNDIIELNELKKLKGKPLKLGDQVWKNKRLIYLIIDEPEFVITKLPESIGNLTELKGLFLSNNRLVSIPDRIIDLHKLEKLHLDGNELVSMPDDIGTLSALKTLYLNDNKIVDLPVSITQLQHLKVLHLANNPIESSTFDVFHFETVANLYY